MKHLLNDLSQEEKNRILEQHNGGKKLVIENFNKLVNNKLGTVKPLINEKITDYFKSREEIADKFLDFLKENPLKALKSIKPYYDDFVDATFTTYDGPSPDYETYPHSREFSIGKTSADVLPNFSKIFVEDGYGFSIDESKLDLVDKITKKEVLNLVSTHENFSLKKLATDLLSPFIALSGMPVYKEIGRPEELD